MNDDGHQIRHDIGTQALGILVGLAKCTGVNMPPSIAAMVFDMDAAWSATFPPITPVVEQIEVRDVAEEAALRG